jgi:hypothetical protein
MMKEQEAKDDYIPFGDEWKKEINQFPKPALIDCVATMLSDKTAENQRLRTALERKWNRGFLQDSSRT